MVIINDIILKALKAGAEVTGTARNFSPIVIGNQFLVKSEKLRVQTDVDCCYCCPRTSKNFVLLKVNEKLV